MWTCPRCDRRFKTTNQSHYCSVTTLDELFDDRSDEQVLAFDRIMTEVLQWEPCTMGVAKKAVVFTSHTAWLVIRPMSKALDVKFYHGEPLEHDAIKKITEYRNKYAHQLRIYHEEELTDDIFNLLRQGHLYSINT